MIDKTSPLKAGSPLLHAQPAAPKRTPEAASPLPEDQVQVSGKPSPQEPSGQPVAAATLDEQPTSKTPAPPRQEPQKTITLLDGPPESDLLKAEKGLSERAKGLAGWAGKLGLGAALGMTALVGMAGVAQAQTTQMAARSSGMTLTQLLESTQNRDQTPVRTNSIQGVVNQFQADRQIYVVGNPQYQGKQFTADEMRQFEDVMKKHPNAYIVLIDNSSDIKEDDWQLSRGIGNSEAFRSNVDSRTGDRNGVVIMVYFHTSDQSFINRTGKDRAIFMRSEQLVDDAGVGEANFVDRETLQNGELINTYISGIQSGRGVPGALDAVFNRIDEGVTNYIQSTVQGSQAQLQSARTALGEVQGKAEQFQRQHGNKGQLGQPPLAQWRSMLDEAQQKLDAHDYRGAGQLSQTVLKAVQQYTTAVSNYEAAPAQAQQIRAQLEQAEQQLATLENNGPAREARQDISAARAALQRYQASHDANNTDFQEHLNAARTSADSATHNVSASRTRTETIKNVKIYGGAALAAATLVTGLALNYFARKKKQEANAQLDKALQQVGDRSQELIRVMNSSDYDEISQYEGMTQKLANDLLAGTSEALTLMGGGEKFIAEAKSMIVGKTIGQRLQNMFLRRNFDNAIDLLTNEGRTLPFDLTDSKNVSLEDGSPAAKYRERLLESVVAQPHQQSLLEILDKMGAQATGNEQLTKTIDQKKNEVSGYLDSVQKEAEQVREHSLKLQKDGEQDNLFTAPSVTRRLLPTVLGEEGRPGLIQRGHEVKFKDPVRAWDEFGNTAKRMATEGEQIFEVGTYSRENLLPALATADEALHPYDVKTDWAHSRKDELSLDLDRTGEKAVKEPVSEHVAEIKKNVAALQSRVETVVEQDHERREVSPKLISDAESDVDTARQGLSDALKAAGVFANGKPDQVLREPDRDPTDLTRKSHEDWEAIKPQLDTGNIEQAGIHLENIRQQTAGAHQLVKESREALKSYTPTAEERRTRRDNITASIGETYADSLKRIQGGYTPNAQKVVAAEVNQPGVTSKVGIVGDYLKTAQTELDTSGSLNSQAQGNYERAYLLTSRDQLIESDKQLKQAQADLDSITTAEKALAQHQKEAEAEQAALQQRLAGTTSNATAQYVRSKAKNLLSQAKSDMTGAVSAVAAKPADPYVAKQALAAVENLRTQSESAISADHRAFDSANASISSAASAISSAQSEINSVSGKSWSTYVSDFGSVHHSVSSSDLSGARSTLNNAESQLSSARSKMGSQDYEDADSQADRARSTANSAKSEAERVESREYSHYRSLVAAAEAEAARRRREREEAQHHSSGGGGGGGGGHHGGSGSTGGGW